MLQNTVACGRSQIASPATFPRIVVNRGIDTCNAPDVMSWLNVFVGYLGGPVVVLGGKASLQKNPPRGPQKIGTFSAPAPGTIGATDRGVERVVLLVISLSAKNRLFFLALKAPNLEFVACG